MRAVIAGAAGLVGTALTRALGPQVFALTHHDLDISDVDAVRTTIADLRPDVVFNCAVLGVDECEAEPQLARRINIAGPQFLAEACERLGSALVHFSTNYVFDGERSPDQPYAPDDDARPVNVYGATKLEGERNVIRTCKRALVIRTSWVYGPGKDSFLSTAAAKLRAGKRVRAITDTWASTTYVEDLVTRTLQLVRDGARGVDHVVNDGALTYEMFAMECARLVGADPALIDRTTEGEMKRLAKRPRVTPMRCDPPLREWKLALGEFVRTSSRA